MSPTWRRLRRRSSSRERGAALVELAAALLVLMIVLVGTIDFGRVMYTALAVTQAARAGAEFGAQSTANSNNPTGMINAAQNAVQSDIGTVTIPTPTKTCRCVPNNPTTTGDLDTASVACTATCSSVQHLVAVVTVNASKQFSTISFYPGIPRTLTITRAMRARVR